MVLLLSLSLYTSSSKKKKEILSCGLYQLFSVLTQKQNKYVTHEKKLLKIEKLW